MCAEQYAVIGDPVAHSLSPRMQGAAFERAGLAARYVAVRVTSADLAGWMGAARRAGFAGFNITVPHKERAAGLVDAVMGEPLGVINTVAVRDGALVGYNTDVVGFARSLHFHGVHPTCALVLGAGGAARAVIQALVHLGAEVSVANRSAERLARLQHLFSSGVSCLPLASPALERVVSRVDLVVNATSLGLHPGEGSLLPPCTRIARGAVAMDLVYGRPTPFLCQAAGLGFQTVDGLEMLVQQGAEAFRLWTGREPDILAMRQACMASEECM